MTIEQSIPLNQLVLSKANVRRTAAAEGIGELAASIEAHGLRQNLNVLPTADGTRFEVVAGGRRLRAMKLLAKNGKLAPDAPVRCLVLDEGEDAGEISLVENAMRTSMHPDDQFEAFRKLIDDKGASIEDVAARFGVTPAIVKQRLKLANVSPKLRALFRKGEMGLEHVMALAISDDHKAQEAAWQSLPEWNRDPETLKDALTESSVALTDKLARFIGTEAYQEAGGAIIRDLFDETNEGYLADRALVLKLVTAKLEREAETVRAEGWKWVKAEARRDHSAFYERLAGKLSAKNKARAGAVVSIAHDGSLQIERGLLDPVDAQAEKRRQKAEASEKSVDGRVKGYAAALVSDLTAHKTAALRIELARNPRIALVMTVHALSLSLLYTDEGRSCLMLHGASEPLERHVKMPEDCAAHKAMAEEGHRWSQRLPDDADELLGWCRGETQEMLLALLAYLAALSVNAIAYRQGSPNQSVDQLANALAFDMTQWWTPSVDGFYGRLPKAALAEAEQEANVAQGANPNSRTRAEAATTAALALKHSGWLPLPLRTLS